MSIKRKMAMWVSGAGLLVGLTVMAVAAAPQTAGAVMNDIPATALTLDGTTQTIAGNSSLWYKFNYGVGVAPDERTMTYLTMVNGTNSGVGFDVYSATQIANWWDNTPIGRGTSQGAMGVQSKDLTWGGKFDANGMQFVKVTNTNPGVATFMIHQNQPGSVTQ